MEISTLRNAIFGWITAFAIAIVVGFTLTAIMMPLPAHAAFVPGAAWAQAAKRQNQAQQTALPATSAPSGVATHQEVGTTCSKGCDSTEPPGFGWFLALLFLAPATIYFMGWCWGLLGKQK